MRISIRSVGFISWLVPAYSSYFNTPFLDHIHPVMLSFLRNVDSWLISELIHIFSDKIHILS